MIKEKKIKRDKNASIIYRGEDNSYYEKMLATGEVKCIDEEIPFEIPTSWSWARLGNLIDIKGGKRLPAGYKLTDNKTDHIYIRVSDMQDGTIVSKDLKYITDDVYNQIQNYTIGKDDLYLTIVGSTIGKAGLVPKMFDNMNLTENAVKLTNIPINKYFLLYYVRSGYAQSQFRDNTKQVGQPKLAIFRIANTLVPIPPFAEQTKIVSKIEYTLHLVNHFSNLQEQLHDIDTDIYRDLKKSILQEAIQGKLVPQIAEEGTAKELLELIKAEKQKLVKEGKLKKSALNDSVIFRGDDNKYYEQIGKKCLDITDEIPFVIPETWQWVRIRDVFQLNPKNEAEDEKLVAFIPMEKISAGYKSDFTFDTTKWGTIKKGFTHFANGDVAFAKITPCFQNRKSAIFHDLPNGIGAGTTELKVLRPYGNTIDRWYLLYFLESPYFIDEAKFKGTANQQRIVVGYLEDKLFPLPTQKEQQRIVEKIEQLMQLLK